MTIKEIQLIIDKRSAIQNKIYTCRDKAGVQRYWVGASKGNLREIPLAEAQLLGYGLQTRTVPVPTPTPPTTPTGPAGGDLSGTYPDPIVVGLDGIPIVGVPNVLDVLTFDGANWVPAPPGGGGVPGGANTNIQFNDVGAFGGNGNLTWDKTINNFRAGSTLYELLEGDNDTFSIWDGTGGIFLLGPTSPYAPTAFKGMRVDVKNDNYQLGNTLALGANVYIDDTAKTINLEASSGVIVNNLAGGGLQMATIDNTGILGVAAIPIGTVTSVSGTANRITSTGGATPVIDIDSAYDALWQPVDATLSVLATYNTNGLLTQTAADTFTGRTLVSASSTVTITNGDGVSGNPNLEVAYGTTSTTACVGNDARLTNYRQTKMFAYGRTTVNSTNTTSEEALASILIPASTLGNNDEIEVWVLWSGSGAGTKTARLKLHTASGTGGTIYYTIQSGTFASGQTIQRIVMKNATNVQEAVSSGVIIGASANAVITSALSNASDMYINLTSQKATGTDSLSLNNYSVKINRI